jgi:serine/threonine protein kinase
VIFVAHTEEECLAWQEAISPYVIQNSTIDQVYDLQKKLGSGSYGNVYLGAPKVQSLKINSFKWADGMPGATHLAKCANILREQGKRDPKTKKSSQILQGLANKLGKGSAA